MKHENYFDRSIERVVFHALELISYEFHFGHLNYLVNTDQKDNEWLPCEVAIVKFSLVSGITEHYHQFIDPGRNWCFCSKQSFLLFIEVTQVKPFLLTIY